MARCSVLIIDDDALLLRFTERYLRRKGYDVSSCRSTREAWDRFQSGVTFQLVLLDVTVSNQEGELSGEAAAERMLCANPGLGLLFWSGYPFAPDAFRDRFGERVDFLQKPFTPDALLKVLERLVRASNAPPGPPDA